MALPALPEVFGNYAVQNLQGLLAPEPVSWLPVTAGWKVVGLMVLLWLMRWSLRRWRHRMRNRYRTSALQQLKQLVNAAEVPGAANLECAQQISRLLKTVALQAFPRTEVAALSGDAWWDWLQRSTGTPTFTESSRDFLQQGQYRQQASLSHEALQLFADECAQWIRLHGAQHA